MNPYKTPESEPNRCVRCSDDVWEATITIVSAIVAGFLLGHLATLVAIEHGVLVMVNGRYEFWFAKDFGGWLWT